MTTNNRTHELCQNDDQPPDHSRRHLAEVNRQRRYMNFDRNKEPLGGVAAVELVKSETSDTCLLSFSGGKDSLCAWIVLRGYFQRIIPYYVYRVPDLRWIDKILDRYESIFETRIYRLPDPNLYDMLRKNAFATPNRWAHIAAARLPIYNWRDIEWLIKYQEGLDQEKVFTATGIRAVDNIQRRIAVKRYGPIHWGRKTFMPIWDYKKARVIDVLEESGIPLSIEYEWFGSSFNGIDYRNAKVISEQSPDDWETILSYFPLAWTELVRYDELTNEYPYGELGNG